MSALYDDIAAGYSRLRQPDERIAQKIDRALADARSVLNVGAGAGSYEPADRRVTALEPSAEMIRQRPRRAQSVVRGVAEMLPFADHQFDAAMAVLTVHHWSNPIVGLREMRRVARDRVIVLTFDPSGPYFWLADYLPEIITLDQPVMAPLDLFEHALGPVRITPVRVPHDCTDGFLGAYWRRPEAYLDKAVRSAISTFAKLGDAGAGLNRLETDLRKGAWTRRYGALMTLDALDIGYRLVVADVDAAR